jgi:hypothetical protein
VGGPHIAGVPISLLHQFGECAVFGTPHLCQRLGLTKTKFMIWMNFAAEQATGYRWYSSLQNSCHRRQ